jgi:hypothetical protein
MLYSTYVLAIIAQLCVTVAAVDPSLGLMNQLVENYTTNTENRLPDYGACRVDNLAVRKEWYALPPASIPAVYFG